MSRDELIKQNAIELAKKHREECEGARCNISLFFLYELLQRAGISVSHEEIKHFI